MARTTPLTNTEVKQAKPTMKDGKLIAKKLSDGDGLQIKISPNGTKSWILNFKCPYTKKMTSMSFGLYPAISLADARRLRTSARDLLAQGLNPKNEKDSKQQLEEEKNSNTFKLTAINWFEVKKTKVSQNYAIDIWRSLELHVFPKLGNVPLNKLVAPKVIDVIRPVSAKGSLETVRRLCQRINEVMVFAVNTGLLNSNPLAGINKAFEVPKKKHMPTLKPNELPDLMLALNTASIKIITRCLIEWQLHTMCRPNESAGARWEEIDFETRIWNIPAERMKMHRPHSIPLTDQTMALLEFIKPISGKREFLFPADRNPRKHANESTANVAISRMGFKGRLVAHGLRALASTTLNEQGFDGDVIESCLSHVDANEVRKAYNRSEYLERRQKVMAWWSNHIEQASMGNMSLTRSKGLKIING
ncbi:integrase domain-containing protein [Psychromonas sp. SR45-3]|uniref:integrase domain-containing protein n=1 Tax=Psychromonas sp. SR45-3 TaxID=2760930 RepID=UPI0015FB401E|nr:integrase domain-containing protein [Psychromonas sp. SR45-3]MBB1272515.1 tyrosine-type recombinase/integrase [Psychromonas sp. SR45-3]